MNAAPLAARRSMLSLALLGALIVGVVLVGCSSTTTTTTTTPTATDAGDATAPRVDAALPDASRPPPGDAAPPDREAGAFDAGPIVACYDENNAFLLEGVAPTRSPSLCTDPVITEAVSACLSGTSTTAGCNAYIAANQACARCLLGGLDGDDFTKVPVGALIPLSDVAVSPNVAACAALVLGRPECALPVSQEVVCTSTACSACPAGSSAAACQAQASTAICMGVGDAACSAAIDAATAQWVPLCRGTAFKDTFEKVAHVMCGAP
ncbi:MAG TPA: hypothetical protein PLR99_03920 [Polyangiaceae bacterium]|nr:hypothetical protein [Polyangiaceae bacterium]